MGFPFLAPLKSWITQSIEERETNPDILNTLMPFVVLSSAAVVTKDISNAEALESVIQKQEYNSSWYKGCVVANSTEAFNNYQLGKTLVGYDLDGKPIEVLGEENRRVSMPIIESMEIDTDGNNNTLKTAQVKIRVFTLKQLEMFELFFLRPSMNVVLEYGWNTKSRQNLDITTHMFANKKHSEYLKKYAEIYSREQNAYKIAKGKYLATLKDTKGNYDFMAGKVTNFNYSPESDGTYSVSLDISAGNELQLWMPVKRAKNSDKTSKKNNDTGDTPYKTWVNKLAADFNNPEFVTLLGNDKDWIDEFFNWGVINTTQKETKFSKEPYISFKLILYLINNMKLFRERDTTITHAHYTDKAKTIPIIPVSSNYIIMSPHEDFILPGKLPDIRVLHTAKQKDVIVLDPKDGSRKDCTINKKSFNLSNAEKTENLKIYDEDGEEILVTSSIGNLLNVYFKYHALTEIYKNSYTEADIINALLDTINSNMFGLCELELQKESDAENGGPLIIMDTKLTIPQPDQPKNKIYKFKVKSINSIVKEFNFNMELSTLMQAQALYSTQLAIAAATKENKDEKQNVKKKSSVPEKSPYKHADLLKAKNADDYYSINAIEIQIVKEAATWNKGIAAKLETEVIPPPPTGDAEEEIGDANEIYEKNYKRFKSGKGSKAFIYTDDALIQRYIKTKNDEKGDKTTALTYLDVTIAIDGIAGISCGEYFHINGVPEIYNKNGYFQVTNVKHGIDDSGWKTTIVAGYRINSEEDV